MNRIRMIAGPNGSGKTTSIRNLLKKEWIGVYINPDDILKDIIQTGSLDFSPYQFTPSPNELGGFFRNSLLLKKLGVSVDESQFIMDGSRLSWNKMPADVHSAYLVSVLSDFIRRKLVEMKTSFTFETVMSSPDKVDFFCQAKAAGFRTYLYFVSTEDPDINVRRVHQRVLQDGHNVLEAQPSHRIIRMTVG